MSHLPAIHRAALAPLLALAVLAAGCDVAVPRTPEPPPSADPDAPATLSPTAAAIPDLVVTIAGRDLRLQGYDPSWGPERAADRDLILRLAPVLTLERGETYPVAMRYDAIGPVTGWLPPDFGLIGGSDPVRTPDGFVAEVPTSAFVRADALPDYEAGLFGVKADTDAGPRTFAYPVWISEPDVLPAGAFTGVRLGIANLDGTTAATETFIGHVRQDLDRGGGPAPALYPTREALDAATDAGDINAWIVLPAGWSDHPTTRNGFASGSTDPITGNGATDTGLSYALSSLIVRALGPAGLVINRGP